MVSGVINSEALNSGSIAGGGVQSLLPPATTGVTFSLLERGSARLVGSTAVNFDLSADIVRLTQIPMGDVGISFSTTADLTVYRRADLDSVETGIGFFSIAELAVFRTIELDFALTQIEFDGSATLSKTVRLSGQTNVSSELTGNLYKGLVLSGASFADFGLRDNGITRTLGLAGEIGVEFDTASDLFKTVSLAGDTDVSLDATAELTQNLQSPLEDAYTEITLDMYGDMSVKVSLGGTASIGLDLYAEPPFNARVDIPLAQVATEFSLEGLLISFVPMQGATAIGLLASGALTNNVEANDPAENSMERPAEETMMVA